MAIRTVFSANVFTLEQSGKIYEELFKWSEKQDKTDWQKHGFYLHLADKGFTFNFFIISENGLSERQRDEIINLLNNFGLKFISTLTDPHPASQ